jgi:hypothetical protein
MIGGPAHDEMPQCMHNRAIRAQPRVPDTIDPTGAIRHIGFGINLIWTTP